MVRRGMSQGYVVILTKLLHPLRLECSYIICNDLNGTPEPRQDVRLQKLDDDYIDSLFRGDRLYPFREIVSSREYPFVLRRGWQVYLSYEIWTPLHERCFDKDRL